MAKVIGMRRSIGEYQGNQYDNTYLYCSTPITKDGCGEAVEAVKVKTYIVNDAEVSLGDNVEFYYDRWRNVTSIRKE